MRRAVVLAFCMTLMLTGCGSRPTEPAPTPSPTPRPEPEQGLYLDVGDGDHRFWVEATSTGEWLNDFERELTLSIYREKEDGTPVQVIETGTGMWPGDFRLYGEDVDFDGNTDFYYAYSQGTHDSYYSFYVWDPEVERFIPDPYDLNSLPSPVFRGKSKTVAAGHRSAVSGTTTYYRYQDGALDPVRACWFDAWGDICRMAVQDKQYGSMQNVFQVERDGAFTDEDWEAFANWCDLDHQWDGHSLYLDVGDGEHRFWVEMTLQEDMKPEEEHGTLITVSVYRGGGAGELVQSWEDECFYYNFHGIRLQAQDVNFDGCPDLHYPISGDAHSVRDAYWIWDREAEQFVRDPYGLEDLSMPKFDPEQKTVEAWFSGADSTYTAYYRYLDGQLTCIRRLSHQLVGDVTDSMDVMVVEDYVDGTLKEVYREVVPGSAYFWPSTDAFRRWDDLDYHGE